MCLRHFLYLFFLLFTVQARAAVPVSYADVVEGLLPSVVSVSATKVMVEPPEMMLALRGSPFEQFFKDFYQDGRFDAPKSILLGSGFVYDANGHIITSAHVVDGMTEAMITLNDGQVVKGRVIGRDMKTDIAVLKVDTDVKLFPVKMGTSDTARVGDAVLAVGNPFGLGNTVTSGIISARSRDIQVGPYDDFIQTDAAINRGNSGGPLFNASGELIGVNTAIFSPSGGSVGIAFSVPSRMAKWVADALIKDGTVRRGRLGLRVQTISPEIAQSLKLSKVYGALVAHIDEKSSAVQSKIKVGDVIIGFNGKEVNSMRALPRMAAEMPIGTAVELTVWREGKELKMPLILSEIKEPEQAVTSTTIKADEIQERSIALLGISIAELTPAVRQKYRLPKTAAGMLVTSVSKNTDAASKGLRVGDLLVEIDKKGLHSFASVTAWESQAAEQGIDSAFLLIDRNGDRFFAVVKFAALN